MLKKHIKFTNFDGEPCEGDFLFNLSRAELIELGSKYPGGLTKHFDILSKSDDNKAIFAAFKEIISLSYGVKSENGVNFRKSPEILDDFLSSNAYDELVMELFTKEGYAAEFIRSIIPQEKTA